jgi:hypothetical protein
MTSNKYGQPKSFPFGLVQEKCFLLGLRWQFGEWEFVKREVERDTNYAKMASAEQENMQFLSPQKKSEWAHGWAALDEAVFSCHRSWTKPRPCHKRKVKA